MTRTLRRRLARLEDSTSGDITRNPRFAELQRKLNLPLPAGTPEDIRVEALERLLAARSAVDAAVELAKFTEWVQQVHDEYGNAD